MGATFNKVVCAVGFLASLVLLAMGLAMVKVGYQYRSRELEVLGAIIAVAWLVSRLEELALSSRLASQEQELDTQRFLLRAKDARIELRDSALRRVWAQLDAPRTEPDAESHKPSPESNEAAS